MSINLTATVKTRHGQGSRPIGRLFGTQMDTLCETFIEENLGVQIEDNFNIGCLKFVDDALSCAIRIKNQEKNLVMVDEFAKKNKLEWGESKCQVMQIGVKVKVPQE